MHRSTAAPDTEDNTSPKAEPFLKWAGGKTQLLSQLAPLFPSSFNRYYEPFVGSGAVFFHLRPATALLNDVNPHLIAVYSHIKYQIDDLLALLHDLRRDYLVLPEEERKKRYYELRDRYNALPSGALDKTALLLFLNKTGYNGLYRESRAGRFNVPFGRYANPAIFDEARLRAASLALQNAELCNSRFDVAVATAQAGDFVYFDPPYVPLSKTASFTSYSKTGFGVDEQRELARVVQELTERGVLVMLSNSDSPLIRDLYAGFRLHEVRATRMINSKAGARGKITELVLTNYPL